MRDNRARDFVLTDYAFSLIRFKARQLCRRNSFSRSDRKDIEQELTTRLLSQAHLYDPERASIDTFVDRVVNSSVAMLLRERCREKRAGELTAQSLQSEIVSDGKKKFLAAEITEQEGHRRNGTAPADDREALDNAEALEQALNAMPPTVSDVCRRVMGGSVASAARELNTSPRQIRNALDVAWSYLHRAGFSKSLGKNGQRDSKRHK